MKRAVYFFTPTIIFFLVFFLSPNKVEAGPYFSKILEGIMPQFSFSIPKYINFGNNKVTDEKVVERIKPEEIQIPTLEIKTEEKIEGAKTSTPTPKVANANINSYLNSILEKLGIVKNPNPIQTTVTPTPVAQNAQQTIPATQPTTLLQASQPQQQNPLSQLTNSLLGGLNRSVNQGNNNPGGNGQQVLATPYNGPGGSIPGDCGLPKGPIAYNIGAISGSGVRCDARTIFVGFRQNLPNGKFGAGYVNPMTEKGVNIQGASLSNCADKSTASEYGEKCFSDYSNGTGMSYIQEQLLHFQKEGERVGQKCVPIDLDNCDAIGSGNYKTILDQIERLNNNSGTKIKVFIKNPHIAGCNFFSHPAVIGATIEAATPGSASRISQLRNKPEQILLFARGGTGSNQNLKQIEGLKIPNSAFSYDSGKEYANISDCTYNP